MAVRDGSVEFIFEGGGPIGGSAPKVPSNAGAVGLEARLARVEAELTFLRGRLGGGLGGAGRAAAGAAIAGRGADSVEQVAHFGYRTGRVGEGAVNSMGGLTVGQKAGTQTALAKAVAGRAGGSAIGSMARASVLSRTLGLGRAVATGNVRGVVGKVLDSSVARGIGTATLAAYGIGAIGRTIGNARRGNIVDPVVTAVGDFATNALIEGASGVLDAFSSTEEGAAQWRKRTEEQLQGRSLSGSPLGERRWVWGPRYQRDLANAKAARAEAKAAALAESQARINALYASAMGDGFTTTFNMAIRTGKIGSIGVVSAAMAGAVNQAAQGAEADASRKAEARAFKEVPPVR